MTWCRRAALLLLPLLVLVSIPERPASAVQTTAAVRFPPPDVAERNDILLDNRVPIRMRDGVIAVCGCVSAGRKRAVSRHRLENAV